MKRSRQEIHKRIFYLACMALAFCIPVHGYLLPPLILLMVLNWLAEGRFIKTFPRVFMEKQRLMIFSFSFLYLLYLIGMSWSDDTAYGLFDLEVKLSLLVFPLIFSTAEEPGFDRGKMHGILSSFVIGCFAGTLIFYGKACYNAWVNHMPGSFYYMGLSWYFHPSYLAMYLVFAVSITGYFLMEKWDEAKWVVRYGLILAMLYFFVFIVLLSSKAGLLSLISLVFLSAMVLFFAKRKRMAGLMVMIITLVAFYIGFTVFPFAAERFTNAGKNIQSPDLLQQTEGSSGARIMVWKASAKVIRSHFIFGVGTGDVKKELLKEYQKENISQPFKKKLNAHNQFIQTFVALGICGFTLLVAMFLVPLFRSVKDKNYLYTGFLLLFVINILVESMFETQAGIIFYAFFNTLFLASLIPVRQTDLQAG